MKSLGDKIKGNFMGSGKMKILKNGQKIIFKILQNPSWEFNIPK